ncbi:MAG: hypothetical protein U0Z26_18610 [Anaerolineales bacterium]
MKKLYFSASNDVIEQVTDLYDFVWPTASAIWNFRWQVKGFVNEVGLENITQQNLLDRFDWGSGIHGVNLKRAIFEKSWEAQQEQFAKFLLINLISIYEGCVASIQPILDFDDNTSKNLQRPSGIARNGSPIGVSAAISRITSHKSTLLENAFYPPLRNHNKNSLPQLENLLICYRFFKECRNSLAHGRGIANQWAYDNYAIFSNIANPQDLNVYEIPQHFPLVVGEPIKLSLRGVVGFGDVIIKLVSTIDAELVVSENAENELIKRAKKWSSSNVGKAKNSLKKDRLARNNQIARLLRTLEFPEPARTDEIETLFLQEGILKENYA